MPDTNNSDSDSTGRTRVEIRVPTHLLDRLHEQYPEARDENAAALLNAAGEGLFHRERHCRTSGGDR